MFCHGELARTKPEGRAKLTFFYLMLALGGALGGIFVGVIAPNVFSTYLELPIGIVASVILALPLLYGLRSTARLARIGVLALAAFVIATRFQLGTGDVIHLRNFYGALQVTDTGTDYRALYNGRTLHGVEFLAPAVQQQPTTYYGPQSGAGRVLLAPGNNRHVALVGLGAGTLAAYGRTGDTFRFYEINPAVIEIASKYFHFLAGSAAQTSVTEGDGRLALATEQPNSFDVIVLDAFSDDSIPVHLMTKEAFALYFRLLKPDGVLAIHLTNRYLDLQPVVQALAANLEKQTESVHNAAEPDKQILAADWVLVHGQRTGSPPNSIRLWTDDYSNLFQLLK
jgi:SAM-dependent methyltransferase